MILEGGLGEEARERLRKYKRLHPRRYLRLSALLYLSLLAVVPNVDFKLGNNKWKGLIEKANFPSTVEGYPPNSGTTNSSSMLVFFSSE